jgi:hypothetical protein
MIRVMMNLVTRAGLGAVVVVMAACEQTVPEGRTASTAPPAGARFIEAEFGPEAMASTVWSVKGEAARKKAAEQWAGMWIPEPGWIGTVEKLEEKDASTNVWFSYPAPAMAGGQFWVAVEFPGLTEKLSPARDVTFTGRIEKVEVLKPAGMPEIRIIVRNAKYIKPS